ncbi:hypothetical protein [Paracidovorax konjaci]|uniref:Uncharacterized protein n=1 Tax=Paracidovorax konjaci TaxID=32040 RepID=A0A1I1RNS9_9BURK|nr:hypothetical protein [Paracidovorax konjaci]SFD33888.1 hypothetical protein SAMN04489710_101150 [Paracidovorax konjaci]
MNEMQPHGSNHPGEQDRQSAAQRELQWEQANYDRKWQENERSYTRRQAAKRFWVLVVFGFAVLAMFGALVFSKVHRELAQVSAPAHSQALSTLMQRSMERGSPPTPLPAPVILVAPASPGAAPHEKHPERDGLPTVPPEVFIKLMDTLFGGSTAVVSSTAELTKKFAEAGIRITEDAAQQILRALLRPKDSPPATPTGAAAGSPAAASVGPVQVFVQCTPTPPRATPAPRPNVPRKPPRCTIPQDSIATHPPRSAGEPTTEEPGSRAPGISTQ